MHPRHRVSLTVLNAGFHTTIQDLGRQGHLRSGISSSGPMDREAFIIANRLVGNRDNMAGLESGLLGPKLECHSDAWISVTGAEVDLSINGKLAALWSALSVRPGDVIQIGPARSGVWSYLAISGGIDVPIVLGSRATYVRGTLGGMQGRLLKVRDILPVGSAQPRQYNLESRKVASQFKPLFPHEVEVRVILGPQQDYFTPDGIETFLSSAYEVTHQIDRMGYRLHGSFITHRAGADIVSDGVPAGAIQVPGDGQPMILLADRQSTGGYSKIATVISADIGVVAQTAPGNRIRFRSVTIMEAHQILKHSDLKLTEIIQNE